MPNETNWQDITRRLDITPATQTDACNHKTRARGRAIGKIPWKFNIPAVSVEPLAVVPSVFSGNEMNGCLIAQFNYTAPSNFKLLDGRVITQTSSAANESVYAISYRVGTTVYRYRLPNRYTELLALYHLQAPVYFNQLIKANFKIEVWAGFVGTILPIESPANTLTTNLLITPDNSDETSDSFDPLVEMARADLDSDFPEALPTVYGDDSSWLTN